MRRGFALALLLLVVAAVLPYRVLLEVFPWDTDAMVWVNRGSFRHDARWTWILDSSHFIAYRPVAAASFLLDDAIGLRSWVYRGTELGLHALAIALVALLLRRLTRDTSPWGVPSLLAALLFALHPVQDEIVTFTSRRSYLLSVVFGLGALLTLARAARDARALSRGVVAGTALLALALLSNEIAFVMVPVALLLSASEAWAEGGWRRAWRPWVLPLLATAAVAWRRHEVLGRTGGYAQRFIAYASGGGKHLRSAEDADPLRIARLALDYVTAPVSFRGRDALVLGADGVPVALAALAVLAALAFAGRRFADPRARVGAILVAWLLGAVAMVGLTRVWFWRLGYPIALPYALVLAWVVAEARRQLAPPAARAAALALTAVLAAPLAWHSAMVGGLDTQPMMHELRGSRIIHSLGRTMREAEAARGRVVAAIPLVGHRVHGVETWIGKLHPRAELQVVLHADDREGTDLGRYVEEGGRHLFVLGPDAASASPWFDRAVEGAIDLDDQLRGDRPTWVVWPDGRRWASARLPR